MEPPYKANAGCGPATAATATEAAAAASRGVFGSGDRSGSAWSPRATRGVIVVLDFKVDARRTMEAAGDRRRCGGRERNRRYGLAGGDGACHGVVERGGGRAAIHWSFELDLDDKERGFRAWRVVAWGIN
ncbi:hypothetical protein E2562_026150 [Oryza meyeriana var. granulata]|uniref:Uncharacterized protein n=1 Tax=Oryza meyeriana var. granulata TaxID=110450 RepID=A0A6G1E1X0_9ORYZ|nr:hypothetical protein E2562_032809 [Oryza meyeriana var. granulata]KAF0918769.1 hypothetical protein E2562_026150 [Oryza meyeriana var. granulata]